MDRFQLTSEFKPQGDQPQAIERLTEGIRAGNRYQVLLGVTGSGKTFTIANVIAAIHKPALVISHNKTLAAQLYSEFKEFFPHNAVEYFVSYYDYYQPEAYVPQTDTYIEKDASINDALDRLRLSATSSLMSRRDVIIVASVSCIYNLGSPSDYAEAMVFIEQGDRLPREELLRRLVDIYYERNDVDFARGKFRVRGDTVEVFPAYKETALRIEIFGDQIERLREIKPLTGETIVSLDRVGIYPAKHFVMSEERILSAIESIEEELKGRVAELRGQNKLLESQRLESRTKYDMEMLRELGYCNGVENYSRHLSGRPPGSRPYCLIDYFPDRDFLTIIDESHVTVPQLGGMYEGDHSRKQTLVEYGFRLPSALDNRPLRFDEFESLMNQVIFVSATPAEYEMTKASAVVEQLIRPTGLVDPEVSVRPSEGQIEDLIDEITASARHSERVLVTTLTKRMAEDLSRYLQEKGLRVKYLHSEIETIERVKLLSDLRAGEFDCLVGINLLREGLDLPEVSLVAILDADKEGFLRSQTSLIQVAGRAARNINGRIIMYADTVTGSMRRAIREMERRRNRQLEYNKANKITPKGIEKEIRKGIEELRSAKEMVLEQTGLEAEKYDLSLALDEFEREMELAARNLQFERAAYFRDRIVEIRKKVNQEG